MKVFISWSKPVSHSIAKVFADWLPTVIQECRNPYISSNTDKGEAWFQEITTQLRESKVGVVFITSQNVSEEWIHLEAGAIFAVLEKRLMPVLVNLKKTDYDGPLRNIQMTELHDTDDMLKLLETINKACDDPLEDAVLGKMFEFFWPRLQESVHEALAAHPVDKPIEKRSMDDKIDEILLQLRSLSQATASGASSRRPSELQAEEILARRAYLVKKFEAEHGGRYVADDDGEIFGEVFNVLAQGQVRVRFLDRAANPRYATMDVSELNVVNAPFPLQPPRRRTSPPEAPSSGAKSEVSVTLASPEQRSER